MTTLIPNLENFIKNFLQKAGKTHIVLGLSGGLDSAVCLALAVRAVGAKNVTPFMLPTKESQKEHLADAKALCEELGVKYEVLFIDEVLKAFLNLSKNDSSLAKANLCARIRMCLLYDASSSKNALVLGSSNKSELALGYGTIYGDLAYAFNPIGEIYKSDLYELAKKLDIPSNFLKKAPSADLWKGQSDEGELGYPYSLIDPFLKAYFAKKSLEDFDPLMVKSLTKRIKTNAFKHKLGEIYKHDLA